MVELVSGVKDHDFLPVLNGFWELLNVQNYGFKSGISGSVLFGT